MKFVDILSLPCIVDGIIITFYYPLCFQIYLKNQNDLDKKKKNETVSIKIDSKTTPKLSELLMKKYLQFETS